MINRLKNYLVVLFGISSVEAKGLIVIFIFILLLLIFSLAVPRIKSSRYDSYYADKMILDSIVNLLGKDSFHAGLSLKGSKTGKEPVYFRFNPNTAAKSLKQ